MVSTRARRIEAATAFAVIGLVVTVIAALAVLRQRERRVEEWLDDRAQLLQHSLEDALDDTVADLTAFAGFIEASEEVTAEEFSAFGARIDLNPAMIAYGFVVPVAGEDLEAFERDMQRVIPGYRVTQAEDGLLVPAADRAVHYPVKYIVPGEYLGAILRADDAVAASDLYGFDAASDPMWQKSIRHAETTGGLGISDFSQIADLQSANTFTMFVPVTRHGELIGFVGGAAVDVLLTPDPATTVGLEWHLVATASSPDTDGWIAPLDVESVPWSLVVAPTDAALADLAGTPWWVIAIAGAMLTLLIAGFVDQLTQRSRSRHRIFELQRVAADKDRFLASVSHEIRTPLTVITGFAHELRAHDVDDNERRQILGLIATQSEEVAGIIEDLLVASRTDLSSVPVNTEAVDLLEEARRAIPVTDHEIEFTHSRAVATADPRRVRQIARNLLTNAVRHGGPRVSVEAGTSGDTAWLCIADDGPPIPPGRVARMFDAYTSAAGDARSVDSIGLGLYVSRTLARLMGGDLTYDHDGSISRFTLSLTATAPADRAGAASARGEVAEVA